MKKEIQKVDEKEKIEKDLQRLRKEMIRDLEKKRLLGLNTQVQRMKNHYDLMTRV